MSCITLQGSDKDRKVQASQCSQTQRSWNIEYDCIENPEDAVASEVTYNDYKALWIGESACKATTVTGITHTVTCPSDGQLVDHSVFSIIPVQQCGDITAVKSRDDRPPR